MSRLHSGMLPRLTACANITFLSLLEAVIRGGVGFHLEDLNRADITLTLKVEDFLYPPIPCIDSTVRSAYALLTLTQIVAANPFIWVAATTFAKASILCFYRASLERNTSGSHVSSQAASSCLIALHSTWPIYYTVAPLHISGTKQLMENVRTLSLMKCCLRLSTWPWIRRLLFSPCKRSGLYNCLFERRFR